MALEYDLQVPLLTSQLLLEAARKAWMADVGVSGPSALQQAVLNALLGLRLPGRA